MDTERDDSIATRARGVLEALSHIGCECTAASHGELASHAWSKCLQRLPPGARAASNQYGGVAIDSQILKDD